MNYTSERTRTSPKGALTLLVHPSNRSLSSVPTFEKTYKMPYFETNPSARRLTRSVSRRRRKKHAADLERQELIGDSIPSLKAYHPGEGEFTLIYFCEMSCLNSCRFTMILSDFLHALQKHDYHGSDFPIQLICVPNEEIEEERVCRGEANILSHLCSQTSFWSLGYNHINRLAMIRILSISIVPSLVVINNNTGKVTTRRGMEAVESSATNAFGSKYVLDQWRKGRSGIKPRILNCCNIL